MEKGLKGQVVVVTGSTRGLGLAIARRFAEAGCRLVVNGSASEEAVLKTLAELPGGEGRHLGVVADVSNLEEVRKLGKAVEDRFGVCDILVNNAGFTQWIPHPHLSDLTEEVFDKILAVNVKGPFFCIQTLAPLLSRSASGLVVNIASIAATTAMGSSVAYCASKAAVINMTRSLARALAPAIRVNAVSPGLVDTELTRKFDPAYRETVVGKTPLGRLVTSEEVAKVVLAVATDMDGVTGHDFVVDGGYLCRS